MTIWTFTEAHHLNRILGLLGCIFAIHMASNFPNGIAMQSLSTKVVHFIPYDYYPFVMSEAEEYEDELMVPLSRDLLIREDEDDDLPVPIAIQMIPVEIEQPVADYDDIDIDDARMSIPMIFDHELPYDDIGSHGDLGEIDGRSDSDTTKNVAIPTAVSESEGSKKKVTDSDSDDEADDDDDDDDHYDYPYGYGGWNTQFGQPKKGKLGSRRQDWDYGNHQHYPYHNPGPHPLDKYNYGGGWSYVPKYHGKYSKYSHGSGYPYPKLSAKLAAKYHFLKSKFAKKAAHHHYYGW